MKLLESKTSRAMLAGAAAFSLAACTDSTGPDALDDPLLLDMAIVAADATLEDVSMWGQPFGFGGFQAAPNAGNAPPGRPGGGRGIGHDLSGTRSVSFFDEQDVEQDHYNHLTTERIHFEMEVEGSVTRDVWSHSVARERVMDITGLAGEETHRTWNGEGSESVSGTRPADDGTTREFEMSGSFAYADVVVPIPGSDPRYPVSGTITRTMEGSATGPNGTRTRSIEMTVTFDGDETATIVVNGESFEIDLTAREGRHPLRNRRGG